MKSTVKGFPGSTLKIIACICMFIDHFAASVLDSYLLSTPESAEGRDFVVVADDVMRCIGRLAFPIFCFLMAEGLKYTHSKVKYLINLAIFTLIAELPFDLALFHGQLFDLAHQNVFFTLLISAALMCLISLICKGNYEKKIFTPLAYIGGLFAGLTVYLLWQNSFLGQAVGIVAETFTNTPVNSLFGEIIACVVIIIYIIKSFNLLREQRIRDCLSLIALLLALIIAELINCDYGAFGVMTVALMCSLNNRQNASPTKTFAWGCAVLTIMNPVEIFAFFALFVVGKYNHKRGLQMKYFFYAFYPAHLLLFYVINLIAGFY